MSEHYNVEQLLKNSFTPPDFIINGVHFGRGDSFHDPVTETHFKHTIIDLKCWQIIDEKLEEVEEAKNEFYSGETYIVLWTSKTDTLKKDQVLNTQENQVYFYWKGEDAGKGFSPLPEIADVGLPVERVVQWAEPPVFLQLFSGKFLVRKGTRNRQSTVPHLYLLRGEIAPEAHFYEVDLKKESLRSRTSFLLHFPSEKKCVVWHGSKSSSHCRTLARKSVERIFRIDATEIEEGSENDQFLSTLEGNIGDYFRLPEPKQIEHTPRLFYFNNITGEFSVVEIESSHKSEILAPFPVLQSHLYTADQPAIFLLDDHDDIWIWYGWNHDGNEDFKTHSFGVAIDYAKFKSKNIQSLVKVHKVMAGFEPTTFTNLFPVWKKREDIAQLQGKDVLPNLNPLIEIISHDVHS